MNRSFMGAVFVAAVMSCGLAACTPGVRQPVAVQSPSEPPHPWDNAQRLASLTHADFEKSGYQGIAPHVPALEEALANADQSFRVPDAAVGPIYRLTDGSAEALGVLLIASVDKSSGLAGRQVVAIVNPYPAISYYLGYYYNEIGNFDAALHALDAGLKLPTVENMAVGEHTPLLISERGAALDGLKRWPEALENFKKGASISGLESGQHAVMLRGEGLSLTELGRLDEAEKMYRDSLVSAPSNPNALRELAYIARLRSGGAAVPTGIIRPNPSSPGKS
jgi:tetratricopeptide (TPR) repeat protein